ncbi:MAG: hypothetical protein LYZ69_06640 [Nitrososphaerales archaeon]|nr:hypothetical protein [Nitrososphaerales archaeon]
MTLSELEEIINERPSLRGIISGFLAEYKVKKMWFSDPRITEVGRFSDHDREHKSDLVVTYGGHPITVQVKSLQSNSVKSDGETWTGKFQCDASDKRNVRLPNGSTLETTCLVIGGFDLLAVNLFEFGREWRFAFARNKDLPRSTFKKYPPRQRKYLLATLMDVSWPLEEPYEPEPYHLLDEIIGEKRGKT